MPASSIPGDRAAAVLAGVGGGMVVSPNQTLTLSEVPERRAGTGGSTGGADGAGSSASGIERRSGCAS
jgi:hypothetical protein